MLQGAELRLCDSFLTFWQIQNYINGRRYMDYMKIMSIYVYW